MIVFCDNEGCIVDAKGKPFRLDYLLELQQTLRERKVRFSVCTGRSTPYIEAMCQCLGLVDSTMPMICEGGAALYHPASDSIELLCKPVTPAEVTRLLPPGSYRLELGKAACTSVYPEPGHSVEDLFRLINSASREDWNVTRSVAAVDVTPSGVTKMTAIAVVLDRLSSTWDEVVAIGDSWNDLPMLEKAAMPAVPANAIPEARRIAKFVSAFESTRGVNDIVIRFG